MRNLNEQRLTRTIIFLTVRLESGQILRTVNPPPTASKVRILLSPPRNVAGVAQLARASAFQADCREFESRLPLHLKALYKKFFYFLCKAFFSFIF